MSTGGGGGRAPLSEINVTPLVDVMLVLLIIFMVAAPMMTSGVQVDLPNADAPPMDIEPEQMMLSIDAQQRVFLGEAEVPMERLEEALRTNARLQEEDEIFVQADHTVPYGFVVRVFTAIRAAGVESVGLVTDPLSAPDQPAAPTP
ncbi:Biopolymer transport protein ExbD/TolR [Sandaracinus amylolyticus]|uniref:Biopolymer transport protein ExbD/TolR n=2 Tax=Sandaracinus amylolyticus TaxID=927083 RepID=A0A0F6WAK7_9BACT|nr:biopolymer transporter ExbD [Sandaracinus amylolyticus]AKF11571.1 Biopolymer transport protein ExbD/TolR [Sandaracinus amylolyticus]